ncbi:ABC transporter permease [Raineyella sp. W15-4]|uniref:ABC transporter permease n=1 Tax=Raineyella sp. W15-4 TaxID=3081651 RepID=UPI002954CB84|nr:ABC transporter permease [Raineyella sp. W15-4]WOQ17327.1 ABC transporter permease [Raineyella sp. W15-4]
MHTLTVGTGRIAFETRGYFRRGDQVFFTFLFPVLMLTIFATAFSSMDFGPGVTAAGYYLPGMLAAGILLSGVQNLGIDIANERHDGTLKRLAGTPLAPASYFIGKLGQVFVTGVAQAALLLVVARVVFDVGLPTDPARWGTFAWVLGLGLVTCALLGIAVAQLPRSGKSAGAVITPVVLVLQFISGVYLPYSQLPGWLQQTAAVFPLKWMAQGMRQVFLPDSFAAAEVGGSWALASVALALALWLLLGFVAALAVFRWIRKD